MAFPKRLFADDKVIVPVLHRSWSPVGPNADTSILTGPFPAALAVLPMLSLQRRSDHTNSPLPLAAPSLCARSASRTKRSLPGTHHRLCADQTQPVIAKVHLTRPGSISYLEIQHHPPPTAWTLSHQEAVLSIKAVGLNFRDVLNILGMDPTGCVRPLGGEAVGVVALAGPGCGHVQLSNLVYGLVPGSLREYAQCDARYVSGMPSVLPFEQAVTLPVVWTTAHFCALEARLGSANTVLIHAASGGVGLTSVEWMQRVHAATHATAGAMAKHRLLHSYGVRPTSSRAVAACAVHLSRLLRCRRLHGLVNSLSNEFISLSFAYMAQFAAFLEIGKKSIWSQACACAAQPTVDYVAAAVDDGCRHCPGWNA
eukprot:6695073-Prymnesium_polylepis.1